MIGDPGEAYILIDSKVGYALRAGSTLTGIPTGLPKRPDRLALNYFHDTRHFALSKSLTP